jgi:uncharacterized protein YrrD
LSGATRLVMMLTHDRTGFEVADAHGRKVGHVESPLFGTAPDVPDALAVRSDGLRHHHFIVRADAIETVDELRRLIALKVDRRQLLRFL